MKELYLPIIAILAAAAGVASIEILTECPPYNSVDTTVHIAHEFDCTKYYKCFMGQKYEMDCDSDDGGSKLYFNPDLQICDRRWNVTCKNEPDPECVLANNGLVWPNPYDCSSYYICDEGKKQVRYCGEGLLFDPVQLQCRTDQDMICNNLPEKCPPAGSSQTMRLPYECGCSEYYECSNGDALLRNCHSGELFDRKLRKCVSNEIADCNFVLTTTTRISPNANPFLDTNDADKIPTFRCPANGSHEIVLLPHECMCNMYFLCKDGEQIRQFCPDGEVFDYVNQVCGDPEKIHCVRPIEPPSSTTTRDFPTITSEPTEPTEPSTTTTKPTVPSTITPKPTVPSTTITKPTVPSTITPKPTVPSTITPKPTVPSTITPKPTVPSTTITKPTIPSTITPKPTVPSTITPKPTVPSTITPKSTVPSTITPKPTVPSTTITKPTVPSTITPKPTVPSTTITKPTVPSTITPKPTDPSVNGPCPPSGSVKIPHETDCNRYYECLNGVKKPGKCLEGHYFNELLQVCDLPENTHCHSSKDAECSTDFRCGIIRFPDQVNCSLYHQCENGRKVVKECSPNLLYNPDKQMCDLPRYVNCSQITQHCRPGDKTPHECRCNGYYECSVDGMYKTLQLCDQGLIFDYVRKECDAPVKTKCWRKEKSQICDPGELLPHEYRCGEYYECSKDGKIKILRQCNEGLRFNYERKMCDKDANVKCWRNRDSLLCEPNELLPHECQCDKYYECARDSQSKILRNCKEGLLFDSERSECVARDRVKRWCNLNSRNAIEHDLGCIGTCPTYESLLYTVHLPHQDCSKFCKCSNGIPYIIKCPQGLHFSKTDSICTYPREADCNTLHA